MTGPWDKYKAGSPLTAEELVGKQEKRDPPPPRFKADEFIGRPVGPWERFRGVETPGSRVTAEEFVGKTEPPQPAGVPMTAQDFTGKPDESIATDIGKSFLPGANQSIGDLLSSIVGSAVEAVMRGKGLGSQDKGPEDIANKVKKTLSSAADIAGINRTPAEETTQQQVLAGAGRGTGSAALFGPAAIPSGAVGGAAQGAVKASGGGPVEQVLAGMGAGAVTGTVQNLAAKGTNLVTGATQGAATNTLQAARAAGVTPRMAGDVAESRLAQQTTAFLRDAPATGSIIQRAAQETIDEIAIATDRAASGLGLATTKTDAGVAVQRGIQGFTDNVQNTATRMYGQLKSLHPPETPTPANNTLQTVGGLTSALAQLPSTSAILTPRLYAAIADDLAATGSPRFDTISRLRTEVGKKLSDPMLVDDISRGEAKQLYASLSKDMEAALASNPQALRMFEISNQFYKQQMTFIEGNFQKLAQHGITPEHIFNWATSEGRHGATRLVALRKAMGDQEFGNISSVVLGQLGKKGGSGEWQPAEFINNWDKLSGPAKRVMFDGPYRESIDNIATLAKGMKQSGNLANTSRTAGSGQLLGWLGILGGGTVVGAKAIAGQIVGQAVASKLLTSPSFAKWLATPVGEGGVANHLKVLPQVVSQSPQIAEEVNEFLQAVSVAGDL